MNNKKESLKKEFENTYQKEADTLFRYAIFRVGSRAEAIDIVQDAFTELWRTISKAEKVDNHRAYLFTVLRHRIIDWYRKKKPMSLDKIMQDEGKIDEPISEEAHAEIELSFEVKEIMGMIDTLPENYRDAVYLRLVEDLPPPEIAFILGSNTNAVSINITRGIKKLKEKLKIDEV